MRTVGDFRISLDTRRLAVEFGAIVLLAAGVGSLLVGLEHVTGRLWVDGLARAVTTQRTGSISAVMTGITSFGEEIVMGMTFGILWWWSRRTQGPMWARFFVTVGSGALVLDNAIKPLVGRTRPAFDRLVPGTGPSFPSGHVVATTALVCALGYLATEGRPQRARILIWMPVSLAALAMAASRIYLGVHWPTDALAGLALGAAWTWRCHATIRPARSTPRITRRAVPRRSLVASFAVLPLALAACSSAGTAERQTRTAATEETSSGYNVEIDPANFVRDVDNPYFPLTPGTTWRLEGTTDEGREVDVITVTERTEEVMGVETTVVSDVVTLDGELAEKTLDWYAQDREGNVWYFGEQTAEYENGEAVSTAGAWEAGVDGALPGIIMNADPTITDSFRQEYYAGEAEDMYWVIATSLEKSVPFGNYDNVIRTLEWTPVEPNVVGEKYYAPGIGLIWERSLTGKSEVFRLVDRQPAIEG
jgi:membrane-associated phospholipid phosphatase